MRRTYLIILIAAALLPYAARAELRVFACEPEWAALVEALGGEMVEVKTAITASQDPHYIEARPSLIAQVRRADLVVCTGADLEIGWLPVLLRQGGNARVQPGTPGYFEAARQVTLLDVPVTVDRAQGDIHPFGNPHVQTDPRNIATIAAALSARLQQVDPANAEAYAARYGDFAARWSAALERWNARGAALAGMQIVVYHRSWSYLETWLELEEVGTLETKPGIPPTSAHLAQLLALVQASDVKLIVRTGYDSERATQWLSRRTGLPDVVLPQAPGAVEGADDLFAMFDTILTRLEGAAK